MSTLTLFAYLDAGTGSMLLQAIMGGFAGVMVLGRIFWQSVLPRFGFRNGAEVPTA